MIFMDNIPRVSPESGSEEGSDALEALARGLAASARERFEERS